ncbi:hypothetical protein [Alicyclobacillus sp. SO9]|uniref:hypothetical protein n=1 Tax=Alicyclobacillus sp. SO9 TaxID=2665646 RepID=UPI0018E77D09|nr:hypothetical protein [Alicyclobacillus sp. SO9]QQE81608.1 hypothetical protein GI364_24760 [Alicyclobacillus sp. SO9]
MSEQVESIKGPDELQGVTVSERVLTDFAFKSDVVGQLADVMHSLAFDEAYDKSDAYNQILEVVEFVNENMPMPRLLRSSH